ncbi:MAG: hypothetical protein ACYTEY_09450, partial [Planctomycetota bacterium]
CSGLVSLRSIGLIGWFADGSEPRGETTSDDGNSDGKVHKVGVGRSDNFQIADVLILLANWEETTAL